MQELAYISQPQGLVFDDDILSILQSSRRNNARLGVTGLLCYDAQHFFQIIEGPDAAVQGLFDCIRADPRHSKVRLLARGPIEDRAFSKWKMDYRRVDGLLSRLGLLASSDISGAVPCEGNLGHRLRKLLAR